jgi:hypothetical protein
MAAMDLEDDEDIWGNTASSPSASPPQPLNAAVVAPCGAFISTQLSLNSRLHLLSTTAAAGGSSPPHSVGAGIFAADGLRHHMGLDDCDGGFRNAAAPPAPFYSAYGLDAGAACNALEDEMCIGPGTAWAGSGAGVGVGGSDRRKKRMIKNRESAARSRARKQAYVRELEREVKLLQQENERLRVKYEQVTDRKLHSPAPTHPSNPYMAQVKARAFH